MKSLKLYLAVIAVFILLYLVAQYNRPKPVDWSQTFAIKDKIPFGTYILFNRLNDIFPGAKIERYREPVYNVINDHHLKHATYIIISDNINLNEYDYKKLKQYVSDGNDVFMAASYFGGQMSKNLKIETQSEFNKIEGVKFTNKYLDTNIQYTTTHNIGEGYFYSIDTAKAVVLGTSLHHHFNFVKYSIGKGSLYLSAIPLMFTNYGLLTSNGRDYVAKALSYLKNDRYIMWDEYYTLGREGDGSEMRVFLRNPALHWAFYIAFFSLIIYIVYEVKRRQRIIPVIEPLKNSTVDFVNVVGQVYYEQRDNSNIAQKRIAYFMEHLRNTYNLKTKVLDDGFMNTLANKSGADIKFIQKLTNQVMLARDGRELSDQELITLNKNIEQFYIQSR